MVHGSELTSGVSIFPNLVKNNILQVQHQSSPSHAFAVVVPQHHSACESRNSPRKRGSKTLPLVSTSKLVDMQYRVECTD